MIVQIWYSLEKFSIVQLAIVGYVSGESVFGKSEGICIGDRNNLYSDFDNTFCTTFFLGFYTVKDSKCFIINKKNNMLKTDLSLSN